MMARSFRTTNSDSKRRASEPISPTLEVSFIDAQGDTVDLVTSVHLGEEAVTFHHRDDASGDPFLTVTCVAGKRPRLRSNASALGGRMGKVELLLIGYATATYQIYDRLASSGVDIMDLEAQPPPVRRLIGEFDLRDVGRCRAYRVGESDTVSLSRIYPDPDRGRDIASVTGMDADRPEAHWPENWPEERCATALSKVRTVWADHKRKEEADL